ncbi:unnamed protein product, partial [Rotaria sp. Silwood2]
KLCNNRRQNKRRETLVNLFTPNNLTYTDLSVVHKKDYNAVNDEINTSDDILNDSFDTFNEHPRNFHVNNEIDVLNYGATANDEELVHDAIFDFADAETEIALEIGKYIREANLDKTKSNKLLKLLNHVYDHNNSPPSSMKKLFHKLNITFDYLTVQYCTNCLSELHESSCSCNINNKQLPSELILFPIEKEIVLANIVEIPKPFRDNEKNCIMLCLWHSPRGPTADILLSRIVQDLSRLMKNGIHIYVNNIGYVHFDLYIQAIIADGPGQSKVTQMVSHNGYFACRVCELEGTYHSLDKTCTYTWSSFIDTSPSFRTKDRFQSCLEEVEHLQKMNNKNINNMSNVTSYKSNTSQRTSAISTTSSQHRASSQWQTSSITQRSPIRQSSSAFHSTSQTSNYFGPVRSSSGHNQSRTFGTSNSQHRASPYSINSPRMNRRQGGMSYTEIDVQPVYGEEENVRPVQLVDSHKNILDVILERCNYLEREMRSLQCKTDKLIKIALTSAKNDQDFLTTKPKVKPNPIMWNKENLLDKPRAPLPTTYLCYLVRKMYTADEIKNKVPQQPPEDDDDDRMAKIKECLVALYFSHEPSLIDDFMSTRGHISLYAQERTKKSRDKAKATTATITNNNTRNINHSNSNIINDYNDSNLDDNNDTF